MVVPPPTGTLWQIVLEHLVDDGDGVDDKRVVGGTNPKPDQLKEIPANDIARRVLAAAVGYLDQGIVRIGRHFGRLRAAGVMRT